jgi:hypothetical protein
VTLGRTARHIQGFISGGAITAPNQGQVLAVYCACVPARIRIVVAACIPGTGGGASDTIMDVRNNNVSVWTNPARRPTLPAGSARDVFTTYPPDNSTVQLGDIITLHVVQAGGQSNVAMTVALEEP